MLMKQSVEMERCIDFLTRMIDKYGPELLHELEQEGKIVKQEVAVKDKENS